jgi:hypothetical protein
MDRTRDLAQSSMTSLQSNASTMIARQHEKAKFSLLGMANSLQTNISSSVA